VEEFCASSLRGRNKQRRPLRKTKRTISWLCSASPSSPTALPPAGACLTGAACYTERYRAISPSLRQKTRGKRLAALAATLLPARRAALEEQLPFSYRTSSSRDSISCAAMPALSVPSLPSLKPASGKERIKFLARARRAAGALQNISTLSCMCDAAWRGASYQPPSSCRVGSCWADALHHAAKRCCAACTGAGCGRFLHSPGLHPCDAVLYFFAGPVKGVYF